MNKKSKKKAGPGRPKINPGLLKIPVGYKLPRWLVEWIRNQDTPAAQMIEDAMVDKYRLKNVKTIGT